MNPRKAEAIVDYIRRLMTARGHSQWVLMEAHSILFTTICKKEDRARYSPDVMSLDYIDHVDTLTLVDLYLRFVNVFDRIKGYIDNEAMDQDNDVQHLAATIDSLKIGDANGTH